MKNSYEGKTLVRGTDNRRSNIRTLPIAQQEND